MYFQMNSMMGGMGQMGQNMPHSTMQPSQMMSQNHGMGINPMMNSSQMLNPMTNQMTGNSQGGLYRLYKGLVTFYSYITILEKSQ